MERRPDAREQLARLLELAPAGGLDEVARRLCRAGGGEALASAVASALSEPRKRLELFLWLWNGPASAPPNLPQQAELLARMMAMMRDLDNDWEQDPATVKAIRHRVRAALAVGGFAAYRQALAGMDEAVAGTLKGRIERCDGLAQAVREEMLDILRQSHPALFVRAKVEPWLDEGAIWTTEQALHRREDELKHLVDVKMFENARAIGAAAEHGDLSENSEWKFALEERDLLRARAAKMQDELARARVIRREDVPETTVGVGSRVLLRRVDGEAELELAFLGPWDSDPERRLYCYQTPLALSLMGRPLGQTVELKLEGAEGTYRIERLSPAV